MKSARGVDYGGKVNTMRKWLSAISKGEAGQALPIVLVLMLLGSLLITPVLDYAGTNLKAGNLIEKNLAGLYAADAGVEDALWKLINDPPASFPHSYQTADVNEMSVDVVIDAITTISNEEIGYPAGHGDSLEVTKSISYDAGVYTYTMYLTNKCDSNIKITKILVDLPANLEYSAGSTSGNITSDNPAVTGNSATGITLIWDLPTPLPTIEPGPDPGGGQYNTEAHIFQLSGPPNIDGVEGHGFVEASRQDVGTIWIEDCRPYSIIAQAMDSGNNVVATIRAGLWLDDDLEISCYQVNP